jgi:hypothetical protein
VTTVHLAAGQQAPKWAECGVHSCVAPADGRKI